MDTITAAALSVDNPLIKTLGLLIDNSEIYLAIIIALTLCGEQRVGKLKKIALALILTLTFVLLLKPLIGEDRPCVGQPGCPWGYSFPSNHAAIAFTLMIAFIDKKSFPFYLLFALFVAFTRLNLGVHTFLDIAGALPVAVISYYITDSLWKSWESKHKVKK